jgi:hypothetical protein
MDHTPTEVTAAIKDPAILYCGSGDKIPSDTFVGQPFTTTLGAPRELGWGFAADVFNREKLESTGSICR